MKYWEQNLTTYLDNYCNICNISIYLWNIHMKRLQHTSETSEIIETYSCNIRFQCNISLLLSRMETHRCVVFTGDNVPAAVSARREWETLATQAAGRPRPRDLERVATHRTWQGRQSSTATRVVLGKASGRAVRLRGQRPWARRRQASG